MRTPPTVVLVYLGALLALTTTALAAPKPVIPDLGTKDGLTIEPRGANHQPSAPLMVAATCAKDATHDGCDDPLGTFLLGVSKDGASVAHWAFKQIGGCNDEPRGGSVQVSTLGPKGLRRASAKKVSARCKGDDPDACAEIVHQRAWRALGDLAADGFVPPTDLITAQAEIEAGIQMHTPVVVLGGALKGYMVYVRLASKRARKLEVLLVSPDNQKAWPLGSFKAHTGLSFDTESGRPARIVAEYASIGTAALVKGGRALLLVVDNHDGGHCSTSRLHYILGDLPAEVTKAMKPAN